MSFQNDFSQKDLLEILNSYALGEIRNLSHIKEGYSNANYRVEVENDIFLLKIFLDLPLSEVDYEVRLLEKLRKVNFPAAFPILNKNDSPITQSRHGIVVISDFLSGGEPEINEKSVRSVGQTVGLLNATEDWEDVVRPNATGWKACLDWSEKLEQMSFPFAEMEDYFHEFTAFFADYLQEDLPKGLIHADVFPENTIQLPDGQLALIDFENASVDHLLVDVGTTINGFCFQNDRLDLDLLQLFLRNYEQKRPLSRLERELLSVYIPYGLHGIIAWHMQTLAKREVQEPRQIGRIYYLIKRIKSLLGRQGEIEKSLR